MDRLHSKYQQLDCTIPKMIINYHINWGPNNRLLVKYRLYNGVIHSTILVLFYQIVPL